MRCNHCDRDFEPSKPWQQFCSAKCRNDWHFRERKRAEVQNAEAERAERLNGLPHDAAKREVKDRFIRAWAGVATQPISTG
jgi:hypothetical protein